MSDNIPFEMQEEIIKRLPVKSLVVFRSVSKLWKSTIDSPMFTTDYTNLRQQHHRLLIRYNIRKSKSEFKNVCIMDDDTLSQHTVRNLPIPFGLHLVGTSKGLLCLFGFPGEDDYITKAKAVIWNPSLEKYITIAVPGVYILGFGVRPDNCDPMIVRINGVGERYPVLVFTLSSRVWRLPRGNLPRKSIKFAFASNVVVVGRCIYWKAHDWKVNLVVAFDMVSEDFTVINLPHSVAHPHKNNVLQNKQTNIFGDFSISKIKESLALLEHCDDVEEPFYHFYGVWMMVEFGSFTKLFTIKKPYASLETNIFGSIVCPRRYNKVLGFRKNGQPIIERRAKNRFDASLEVYEPRTGTIKNLWINGEHGSFFCCSYTETLLLLDQLDGLNL